VRPFEQLTGAIEGWHAQALPHSVAPVHAAKHALAYVFPSEQVTGLKISEQPQTASHAPTTSPCAMCPVTDGSGAWIV
jgi:hypothetical protein